MQPPLVITLQLIVEDHSIDAGLAVGEALGFTQVRAIHLGVVFDLARLLQIRVELLPMVVPVVLAMIVRVVAAIRLQHVPTLFRQHDRRIHESAG